MAERLVLHVGAMKSGTSYIQGQLFANQEVLREQGFLVPGQAWNDQVQAVVDVIGRPRQGLARANGAWARLVDEVEHWPGTAVVSMEFLGPQGPRRIRRIVSSFPDTHVCVVLSVRDLNRSIAAMWQESIQNGRAWSWDDYRAGVELMRPGSGRGRPRVDDAGRTFWRQQNLVRLARNWKGDEGVSETTLVTVPPPGAPTDALMSRFADVAGMDASALEPSARDNASLDAASVEVLRRLNDLLDRRGLAFPQGAGLRKQRLAKQVLAGHRRSHLRLGLPVADWVRAQSERTERGLRRVGVDLVGDWKDLDPVDISGIHPAEVPAPELRDAAEHGLAGLGTGLATLLGEDWAAQLDDVTGADEADLAVRRLARLVELGIRAKGGDRA